MKWNKQLIKRVADVEERNKSIEKDLEEIKAENEFLRTAIYNSTKKNVEITEVEKATTESESGIRSSNADELDDKIEEHETNWEVEENVIRNKCEKCDFIGKSEAGLKIHNTSKHKGSLMKMYRKVGDK